MSQNTAKKGERSYRNPLNRHILIGCFIFIAVLCLTMGVVSFIIFSGSMMNQYESHIGAIMNFTMSQIDVEDLEKCIESGVESERYRELVDFMDQARRNYNLEYIAIVKPVKEEGKYDVIQVVSGLLEEERMGKNKKDLNIPLLGDRIGEYYPEEFISVIYDDLQNRHDIKYSTSETDFGRTFDGATPIRNEDGEGVALLTAGITLHDIDNIMRRYVLITVLCAVALSILFLSFMMFWLRRRIINPLKKIEKTAGEFAERSQAQKDPELLILEYPDIHTGDELESLAGTLVSMSKSMKAYVEDILDSSIKMENMEQEMSRMNDIALKDALTGTKNKAAYDKAKNRLDWDITNHMANFAILMIDLNYLKRINDTFGHEKGDIYIRNMCKMICDTFAHSPVYRIGGDEFVVILENRDLQSHEELIRNLREKMEDLRSDKTLEAWERVSAAIGLAIYDESMDENADSVFQRSDKIMYENKKEMKAVRTE